MTVRSNSCLAVQSLLLEPALLGNPSSRPLCCSSSAVAAEGGGQLWGTREAWPAARREGGMEAASGLGVLPGPLWVWEAGRVLQTQESSQFWQGRACLSWSRSRFLPGYLLVDCLKYQRVLLLLCSCTFQPC